MFYGAMIWDPWLIVAQIACLQCLYYLSLGSFLWLFVGTHEPRFTLQFFFDYTTITARTFAGWCTMFAFLANSLAGAGSLLLLVERTKKCLDFTVTVYFIHLFFCIVYKGVPSTLLWWVLNGVCLVVMTVLGEWLCMRREQREIPIGGNTSRSNV
eukprot:jgi/Mesen1/9336/ME000061S08784